MENVIRTSVRNMVEFVMRSGDIDTSFMTNARAVDGIHAHQKLQREYGPTYAAEVMLSNITSLEDIEFHVEGRADGVICEDGDIIIDEIKSTTRNLEDIHEDFNFLHWAQAKCYGYFYALDHELEGIHLQLTYYNIEEDELKRFRTYANFGELKEFYLTLLLKYMKFSKKLLRWNQEMQESAGTLTFPFSKYRGGQREMAVATYQTILQKTRLFVEAPTGIGKTMSVLFPGVKAIGAKELDKIFYLTARSTTKDAAKKALYHLTDRGLKTKAIIIQSKEKSCINDKVKCNPEACSFAKGHFDRVNEAIEDILEQEDILDKEILKKYAEKHQVCPFEYELDLSLYCDVIICDYNYVFDPSVYLRRFFDNSVYQHLFLVDEAHNLIDRGRDMYSAEINISMLQKTAGEFKEKYRPIYNSIQKISRILEDLSLRCKNGTYYSKEKIEEPFYPMKKLVSDFEPYLIREKQSPNYDDALELYFSITKFLRISEYYSDGFYSLVSTKDQEITLKYKCVGTGEIMKDILQRSKATVMFSATLTPMDFYLRLLGGSESSLKLHLGSPFDSKHLLVAQALDVSTRYKDRSSSSKRVAEYLRIFTETQRGNYIVFFPSYAYMRAIYDAYTEQFATESIVLQEESMSEQDRDRFLELFTEDTCTVGFCVLGGVFSEGIDLVGDKLIGVAVVSVGLPGLSLESDIIREHFNETLSMGFEYAYMFPGMNKVLQAAGRVIRTAEDRGVVLLIDDRFRQGRYQELMPRHWRPRHSIYNIEKLRQLLQDFWSSHTENIGEIHGEKK